jgi:hypothetical protein
MGRSQSRLVVFSMVMAALAVGGIAPAAVSAASPVAFDVLMGDQCVDGFSAEIETQHFVWKDEGGATKADAMVTPVDSGNWQYCSSSAATIVEPGDDLSITYQDSVHELTIPELTLFQNRVSDRYKGRGPAGQYVKLICGITNGFEPCDRTWRVRANSSGQWGVNPHWDVRGDQWMYLMWRSDSNDHVQVENLSPYVDVTIGRALVTGSTRAGTSATVVDRNSSTFDIRGTMVAQSRLLDGTFSGKLRNGSNKPINVHAGDLITSDIASDASWTVGDIQAIANASTNRVRGLCAEEARFEVGVFREGVFVDSQRWYTDGDGSFKSDPLDLQAGDQVVVGCQVQATGDWIHKWFTAS